MDASLLLGILGPALVVVAVLAAGYAYSKSTAGKAWQSAAEGWKEQAAEREARADVLREENVSLLERVAVLETKVEELLKRPDFTDILTGQTALAQELAKVLAVVIAVREEQKAP